MRSSVRKDMEAEMDTTGSLKTLIAKAAADVQTI